MSDSGRICDEPGCENPAELKLTHVVENESATQYLCQDCAAAKGVSPKPQTSSVGVADFLADIVGNAPPDRFGGPCDCCSMTFNEFRRSGRFGCSGCYTSFKGLRTLLFRIHGSFEHVGKLYNSRAGRGEVSDQQVEVLRRRLDRAVAREDFESAAKIRDRIKEFEGAGEGEGT